MNAQTTNPGELIYEADIHFTDMVEYGVGMEAIASGQIPLEGARFDQAFEGELHGPRLRGRIVGTDYLYVRADGHFQLHLHAQVITDDGANISFSSTGVSLQIEGERASQLRASVSLFTSLERYKWLNHLQLWVVGTLDPIEGKAFVRAYAA